VTSAASIAPIQFSHDEPVLQLVWLMTRLLPATDTLHPVAAPLVTQAPGDVIFIHVLYNGAAPFA
jgi:hypothetical protein